MASLKDLTVTGASNLLGDAYLNTIKSGVWNGTNIAIANGGTGSSTLDSTTLASGDNLIFYDSSDPTALKRSSISIGSGTTKYLREDGTWQEPPGSGVTGDYLPLSGGTLTGTLNAPTLNVTGVATFDNDIEGDLNGNAATATTATYGTDGVKITSIPVVIGTLTSATGSWTGSLVGTGITALYDGLTINYYLPYAGSGNATLNLTLDGGSTTGAINCYYGNTTRLTTHYAVGNVITLTYFSAGSIKITGTATTDNRWIAKANYNTDANNYDRIVLYHDRSYIDIGNNLGRYTLCMRTASGGLLSLCTTNNSTATTKSYTTVPLRIDNVYYYNTTVDMAISTSLQYVSGDARVYECYGLVIDYRYSLNCGLTLTAHAPLYIFGTPNGNYFTMEGYSHILPSEEDGKIYIYIGVVYPDTNGYRGTLEAKNLAYWYKDGALRLYSGGDYLEKSGGTVTGTVTFANPISGNILGNANTATALANTRTIALTGNATGSGTFNGTANLSIATTVASLASTTTGYFLKLQGSTSASNTATAANPRVGFYNSSGSEYAVLTFTDSDSVKSPNSVTLAGNTDGMYFIAPNIEATSSVTTGSCTQTYDSTNQCLKFSFS